MIEQSLLLFHDHFLVGEGRSRDGAPVDHAPTSINQFLFEKVDKNLLDAGRVFGIHGKAFSRPVAGGSQLL